MTIEFTPDAEKNPALKEKERQVALDKEIVIAKEKADKLTEEKKHTVVPMVFLFGDEIVTGYFKEPSRMQKAAVWDKSIKEGPTLAAAEILPHLIDKENSDARFLDESSKYDSLFFGACMSIYSVVKTLVNQVQSEKKN